MEAKPCIFCQIARKETPSKIVYEDESSVAFLDIAPRSKGMAIVVPRQHYESFDENFDLSLKVFQSALLVAEMIKQALGPKSINLSIMPSPQVPHFHVRVYPVYEDQIPLFENKPLEVAEEELTALANKIRSVRIEIRRAEVEERPKEEVKEEEEKEEERSKEEAYWIRREIELA